MKIVFMGTPEFAVPSLRALIDAGYEVTAVVTQPDRPKGRKRVLTPPPVKIQAEKHGIAVLQPEKLREPDAIAAVAACQPDLIVTAAYGQILPKAVLDLPQYGCINVHASLLPKYRGAAPIQYALMNGEQETGVTIMYMEEGLDTGDMISSVSLPIRESDDAGTLFQQLSEAGAKLLIKTLPNLLAGRIEAVPQQDELATYARMLTREDERIDWSASSLRVFNQVRALRPWPGAFTLLAGDVFKIWRCEIAETASKDSAPGTVLSTEPDAFEVACGEGTVRITEVQPAGKTAMPAGAFLKSGRIKPGMRLGAEE